MTDGLNAKVTRPTPTWEASHDWSSNDSFSAMHRQGTKVSARFSHNFPEASELADGVSVALPNEIAVSLKSGDSRDQILRFRRSAARQLMEMLQAALEWDGQDTPSRWRLYSPCTLRTRCLAASACQLTTRPA